jgi:hypothetical protein
MPETASTSNTQHSKTLAMPISPPRPSKKPRRQLSNAERAEVRRYFYDDSIERSRPCGALPSGRRRTIGDLFGQLAEVERDMRALQVANSTQTTLDGFFAAQ